MEDLLLRRLENLRNLILCQSKENGTMLGFRPILFENNIAKFNVKDIENLIKENEKFDILLEVFIKGKRFIPIINRAILVESVKVSAKKLTAHKTTLLDSSDIKVEAKLAHFKKRLEEIKKPTIKIKK